MMPLALVCSFPQLSSCSEMIKTSFYRGESYSKFDAYYEEEDREHDDYMTAEDYERREYYRTHD
jgi:hypothetical protein